MLKPEDLDYNNQAFDTTSIKSIKLTNVLRSLSRPSDSNESIKDKIDFLEKLVGLCNYGSKFSKRIKLDFQLANEIFRISYTKLLNENEWNLFKMILYSNLSNKFEFAREFVSIYDMNLIRISEFVLEELLNTLNFFTGMNKNLSPNSVQNNILLNPFDNAEFSKLIKIFDRDINLFGWKLLERSRKILNDAKNTDEYTILTELLVRSHDCFTQSCSMEGISNVLQTCKLCAAKLEKAGEFNIMVYFILSI